MRGGWLPLVVWLALETTASADVIVTEALVNEPGGAVSLEWIELYNDSTGQADLSSLNLRVGTANVSVGGTVSAKSYVVICRRLISSGGTPGFEQVWGNNSGIWGDVPEEHLQVVEASFSLSNSAGGVQVSCGGVLVSQLNWPNGGKDGISWERVSLHADSVATSIDVRGATPGRLNSVSATRRDLAITAVTVIPSSGETGLRVLVQNMGFDSCTVEGSVCLCDSIDSAQCDDTLANLSESALAPGQTISLLQSVPVPGMYRFLRIALGKDDRPDNSTVTVRAVGEKFPPIRLMEFLANPETPLSSEWVEVQNISDCVLNLVDWQIGDSTGLRVITSHTVEVQAGERIVLAEDSVSFKSFYPAFMGLLLQPLQWPALNNGGDLVRLVDSYGFEADRFTYGATFDGNVTWGREESSGSSGIWGEAGEGGGTPGEPNILRKKSRDTKVAIMIEPQIISPDGDGRQDFATISLRAPDAGGYTLRIYDREGRVVRTLLDDRSAVQNTYRWDGRTDTGSRLPIGIYVCHFEAAGIGSARKAVVIAR